MPETAQVPPAEPGVAPYSPPPAGKAALSGIGLIVGLLALPVVLLAGGHWSGWFIGFLLWCANWGIAIATGRWTFGLTATAAVGMSGVSFIARAWLIAIVLFVIALRYSEEVGLIAAGVFITCFTFDLLGRTALYASRSRAPKGAAG